MTDLDIELEHIYLEAKWERWEQVERFLFPYFCFKNNFVTSQNKPDWELARSQCPRSENVTGLKDSQLICVIPEQSIIGEIKILERDGNLTKRVLKKLLDTRLAYCVVSKAELGEIKQQGLLSNMPREWYHGNREDLYARIDQAGITLRQAA